MKNLIIVTGGAGFVGSNLIKLLLKKTKFIIISIDNYSTGNKESLPSTNDNIEIVEGTIFDKNLVESIFKSFKPECVIHSAASYKDPDNWLEDINTNIIGSINIAKASGVAIGNLLHFLNLSLL